MTNMKTALAFGFGVESQWMREKLHLEGIMPLLIVCKSYNDHLPKRIDVLLKGEHYIVLRRKFHEQWNIHEDFHPHWFSCKNYTNTIIEWARQQTAHPFDILYLGRRLQDLLSELSFQCHADAPFIGAPKEAFGFKLEFPYWNWSREGNVLMPPILGLKT